MQIGKRKQIVLLLSILAVGLLAGAAVATIVITHEVSMTCNIAGSYDFTLYTNNDFSSSHIWTTEAWGTMTRGTPMDSANRWAKNVNPDPIYISWSCVVPTGYTLTAKEGPHGTLPGAMTAWPQNTFKGPLASGSDIIFYFTLTPAADCPAGTQSITLTFSGSDTGA